MQIRYLIVTRNYGNIKINKTTVDMHKVNGSVYH